jgi:uncharacterized small protein (DUF1192 family)
MFDEDLPRPKKQFVPGQKLDDLSIADLDEAIADLQAEITRLESAKAKKSSHMSAAEALFARKT